VLTNIKYFGQIWIKRYISVIHLEKIIKMESLKDITNEMLPNEILIKIDNYL